MPFKTFLAAAAVAGALLAPVLAHADDAPQGYYNNYSFSSLYPVTNINILTGLADGSTNDTYTFTADTGPNTITNGFAWTSPTTRTFMLGVATDLPGDPDGQQHLVLFTNTAFAASAEHIAFGTLFPNTDEDTLINYIEGNFDHDNDPHLTFTFYDGDSAHGPNGDLGFTPGDSFSEIAFSTGQIIGTGISYESLTPGGAPISAAPEPSTWLLMTAGVGLAGLTLRQRRKVAIAAA
jgi:hypothetical protein